MPPLREPAAEPRREIGGAYGQQLLIGLPVAVLLAEHATDGRVSTAPRTNSGLRAEARSVGAAHEGQPERRQTLGT